MTDRKTEAAPKLTARHIRLIKDLACDSKSESFLRRRHAGVTIRQMLARGFIKGAMGYYIATPEGRAALEARDG